MQVGLGSRMDALRSSSSSFSSSTSSSSSSSHNNAVFGGRIVRLRTPRRPAELGRSFVRHAKDKGPPKEPGEEPNQNKADFSAFWALRIKNLFSSRRKYLDEADRTDMIKPDIVKKLEEEEKELLLEYDRVFWAEMEKQREEIKAQQQNLPAAEAKAVESMKPFESLLGGPYEFDDKATLTDSIIADIDAAQADVRKASITSVRLALRRSRKAMYNLFIMPMRLLTAVQQAWSSTFTSQRYENFLMSEGERIWFWRNRTENERWFWEVHFWNQILFPIICAIAYQMLTPAHILWAVVIPFMFIKFESGRLPGIFEMEFWLIMYFGLYKKCWGDVMGILGLLRF